MVVTPPLKKIDNSAIIMEVPKPPKKRDSVEDFYQTLIKANFNIDLKNGYKHTIDSLAKNILDISNSLIKMQEKGSSLTESFFERLTQIPLIKPAKPYLDTLFTGYIPQLSDFQKYVRMQTEYNSSLKREDYLKPLVDLTKQITKNLDKSIFSLARGVRDLNKAYTNFFSKSSNENFYGVIPLGYIDTINYGKLRWEKVDFTKIDPIAAQEGVVLYNGTTRPDMNMSKLGLKLKGNRESLTPYYLFTKIREPSINKENPYDKKFVIKYDDAHFDNPKFSRTVSAMLKSGADFINNMFDVFIVYRDKENNLKTLDENLKGSFVSRGLKFERILNGTASFNSIFMIRASTIQVPQIKNETFDLKWIDHTVKKIKSKINYERKSELKILMDEPMYMNLLFNIFAGTGRASTFVIEQKAKTKSHNTYSGNLTSFDIIIKHEALLNYPYIEAMKNNWRAEKKNILHAGLSPEELPLWWFRDVRFLGESSNYTFNRESPSIIEGTFPFTFSRCVKIDRSAKILMQNVLFNNTDKPKAKESSWLDEQTMGQGNQRWMLNTEFWKNWNGDFNPGSISYSEDAPKYDAIPQNMGIPQFIG